MDKKFILIILTMIFLALTYSVSAAYINKITFEKEIIEQANKNEEQNFKIDNITMFSSAESTAEIQSNSTLNLSNLYQYTDIAIFIKPNEEALTLKNTLKEVYIDNIKYVTKPEAGTPNLYYKNISEFATSKYTEENKIEQSLHFNITSEETADLSQPTLYNNCANPITLTYVNNNIKTDFTLADAFSQITYDGSLLKKCSVTLSSIQAAISFDIHIKNNLDQEYISPIYIKIPLETPEGESIYDGKVLLKGTRPQIYRK